MTIPEHVSTATTATSAAQGEAQRLREALEQYAAIENWGETNPSRYDVWLPVEHGFKVARAAIAPAAAVSAPQQIHSIFCAGYRGSSASWDESACDCGAMDGSLLPGPITKPIHVTRWRCSNCYAGLSPHSDSGWRWDGKQWEHKCYGGNPQVGCFLAEPTPQQPQHDGAAGGVRERFKRWFNQEHNPQLRSFTDDDGHFFYKLDLWASWQAVHADHARVMGVARDALASVIKTVTDAQRLGNPYLVEVSVSVGLCREAIAAIDGGKEEQKQ